MIVQKTLVAMYWLVMTLCSREPSAVVAQHRGMQAAAIVWEIDARHDEKAILLSIAHHESRFDAKAINKNGKDCGPTQIRNPEMWGSTCAKILADEAEGYRVALRVLRYAQHICPGSWARTLTAYASGVCGVAPLKARELCAPTGLCDTPSTGEMSADPRVVPGTYVGSVRWLVPLGDRGFWAANDNAYAVAG